MCACVCRGRFSLSFFLSLCMSVSLSLCISRVHTLSCSLSRSLFVHIHSSFRHHLFARTSIVATRGEHATTPRTHTRERLSHNTEIERLSRRTFVRGYQGACTAWLFRAQIYSFFVVFFQGVRSLTPGVMSTSNTTTSIDFCYC